MSKGVGVNGRLFCKLFAILCCVLAPEVNARYHTLFTIGRYDTSSDEFRSDLRDPNPGPPSASELDDHFYIAGSYPEPIGLLTEDEDTKNWEWGLTPRNPRNVVHFTLSADEVSQSSSLFLAIAFVRGGPYSPYRGVPEQEIAFSLNGDAPFYKTPVFSRDRLFTAEIPVDGLSLVAGENTIEIKRAGQSATTSFVAMDFVTVALKVGTPVAMADLLDSDGDGLTDQFESENTSPRSTVSLEAGSDLDGDGFTALEEFALDLDPTSPDSENAISSERITIDGKEYYAYTYRLNKFASSFLDFRLERSQDLGLSDSWTSENLVPVRTQPVNPHVDLVTLRSTVPISQAATQFYRLKSARLDPQLQYILGSAVATSAGVFDAEGNLLRTLWSNRKQASGTYSLPVWDGLNDEGRDVSELGDTIRVVGNAITVEWEGVIGNTSDSFTGPTVHASLRPFFDMMIHDGRAYFAHDNNEDRGSVSAVNLSHVQRKIEVQGLPQTRPATMRICTDGERIYMGSRGGSGETERYSFVCASTFENLDTPRLWLDFQGETVTINDTAWKAANVVDSGSNRPRITGMAVQRSGSFLFVAREGLNKVHVLDKLSGSLVRELDFTEPKHCKIDGSGLLWLVHDEVIESFSIDAQTGELSTTGFTLSGFTDIQAIALNADQSTIAVADNGTYDQVFGYSTVSGALEWTLGRAENYAEDATVYDNKFLFKEPVNENDQYSFLVFEADGSLWICDRGNARYLKFDSNRNLVEELSWHRAIYNLSVCQNDPTRIFANYYEFEVDYGKPLQAGNANGAWKLVKNWGGDLSRYNDNTFHKLKTPTTFSNGRTYALMEEPGMRSAANYRPWHIVELVDGGSLRPTEVFVENDYYNTRLKSDGVFRWSLSEAGVQTFYEKAITGFDANNDPILGETTVWGSYHEGENRVTPGGAHRMSGEITANGTLVVFDGGPGSDGSFHLAGLKRGAAGLSFQTAKGVKYNLSDPYPYGTGLYDARDIPYLGSIALAMDDWILWGYNGEFWRQTQTNMWHMVSEEGLFLRDFGVTGDQIQYVAAPAGMAGNAFAPDLVKVGNIVYLYHNDESFHGGIHRWKISALDTIQRIEVKLSSLR